MSLPGLAVRGGRARCRRSPGPFQTLAPTSLRPRDQKVLHLVASAAVGFLIPEGCRASLRADSVLEGSGDARLSGLRGVGGGGVRRGGWRLTRMAAPHAVIVVVFVVVVFFEARGRGWRPWRSRSPTGHVASSRSPAWTCGPRRGPQVFADGGHLGGSADAQANVFGLTRRISPSRRAGGGATGAPSEDSHTTSMPSGW